MWRRVLARLHDDAGGSHELFLFGQAVREAVGDTVPQSSPCSRCSRESRRAGQRPRGEGIVHEEGRVPFPRNSDFAALTSRALRMADEVGSPFVRPLLLLHDCRPIEGLAREQDRGASFKQLAAIGHALGMNGAQRTSWYRIAESVPLAQRHAGHILSKLKGRG